MSTPKNPNQIQEEKLVPITREQALDIIGNKSSMLASFEAQGNVNKKAIYV